MTKLHEVVRGVEMKKTDYGNNSLVRCSADATFGYNSLASAEVVVDREKIAEEIKKIIDYTWSPYACDSDCLRGKSAKKLAQAIATAIESGSIISLKEEK